MRPIPEIIGNATDAHTYHDFLAELYEEIGDYESAVRHLEAAKKSARAVGATDTAATCSSQIAELRARKQRYRDAQAELEEAIAQPGMSLEDRAIIYKQLLAVLLRAKRNRRARDVFKQARELMSTDKLYSHYIDLHMSVFDYNWKGDRIGRLSALKMYAAAAIAAIVNNDSDAAGKVMGHLMVTLTNSVSAPSHNSWSGSRDNVRTGCRTSLEAARSQSNFCCRRSNLRPASTRSLGILEESRRKSRGSCTTRRKPMARPITQPRDDRSSNHRKTPWRIDHSQDNWT